MSKGWTLSLWGIFLLWPVVAGSETNGWIKTIEQIKRTTGPILYVEPGSDGTLDLQGAVRNGSGFFIGREGYFVTAAHVPLSMQQSKEDKARAGIILVTSRGWKRGEDDPGMKGFRFEVVTIDEENDLALCKTRQNPFKQTLVKDFLESARLTETIPPDGTPVGFTGFPPESLIPFSARGILGSYQKLQGREQSGSVLLIHGQSWFGVSGSPLYLEDGRVIGLVTGVGTERYTGMAIARPVNLIRKLLQEASVTE